MSKHFSANRDGAAAAPLVSIDTGRQTLLVRKTLEGCPRHVLYLKASALVGTITETGANLMPENGMHGLKGEIRNGLA